MRRAGAPRLWLSLAVVTLVLAGCAAGSRSFSGRRAMSHARQLVKLGPRPVGTEANRQAADYIEKEMLKLGWRVEQDCFAYRGEMLCNVIAKRGTGPIVLVGTHYDTRPVADRDPVDRSLPVPGANDGASGVAVLLELARVLDPAATEQMELWLVYFDGEDSGDLAGWEWAVGARHLAQKVSQEPRYRPEYVIIVDMVGDADQTLYYEWSSSLWLKEALWDLADTLDYGDVFVPRHRHHVIDDHTPFLQIGVPAVLIIDLDYPYWHTQYDTLDKLSARSLERVGHVLQVWLEGEPLAMRAVSR